jgi:hypothetical protein
MLIEQVVAQMLKFVNILHIHKILMKNTKINLNFVLLIFKIKRYEKDYFIDN